MAAPLITARAGGSKRTIPRASETNPGVIRRAPPKRMSAPSVTSAVGIRPRDSVDWSRRHVSRPCCLSSHAPATEIPTNKMSVVASPSSPDTWTMTQSSTTGTASSSKKSTPTMRLSMEVV